MAAVGLALAIAAPAPRVDLLVIGVALAFGAIVCNPITGPALIGASLPFFFFSHDVGRLALSGPELALLLTWLALPVLWARDRLTHAPKPSIVLPFSAFAWPTALFLVAALSSLLVTQYTLLSVRQLRAVILEPILFFWLLRILQPRASARAALLGFLGAATATAAAAIAQVAFGIGGTAAEGVVRAQAWYPSANQLALTLGRALPAPLAYLAATWRTWAKRLRQPERIWPLALAGVALAILGAAILLTFSLGAWLGVTVACAVVLAALGLRRAALGLGGTAAACLLVVAGLAALGRLPERLDPARQTTGFRLDLWVSSLQMLRDHPILGIGLDNFVYLYQQIYLLPGAAEEPNLSHPHNWVLHVWLSLGLLGLVAFLWLLAVFWRRARRVVRAARARWYAAAAIGAMVDLLVHGLVDNSYFLVDLAFLFWLCLALVDVQEDT